MNQIIAKAFFWGEERQWQRSRRVDAVQEQSVEKESLKESLMDVTAVLRAYRRWAPVYDYTFGQVAEAGRKHAVEIINRRRGTVLEVGVGTGLSLPCYGRHLEITGIDLSPDMLSKARERAREHRLGNVAGLHMMDASDLEFANDSFDTVVAMYVMTVVPEPELVMSELERVCAPGGEVVLVNHFSSEEDGVRGWVERRLAPLSENLGWRPVFPIERVLGCQGLRLAERRSLRPFGLFTMLRFVKQPQLAADSRLEKGAARRAPARLKPAQVQAFNRGG